MNNILDSFVNLCRLCLKSNRVEVSIFQVIESPESTNLLDKITTCLPVNITDGDELPRKICCDCSKNVDFIFNFWQLSACTEEKLHNMLKNLKGTATEMYIQESNIEYDTVNITEGGIDVGAPLDDITSENDIEINEVYFGDYLDSSNVTEDDVDSVVIKEEMSLSETDVGEMCCTSPSVSLVKPNCSEDTQISQIVESSNVSLRSFVVVVQEEEEKLKEKKYEEDETGREGTEESADHGNNDDTNTTLRLWDVTLGPDLFLIPYDEIEPVAPPEESSASPVGVDVNTYMLRMQAEETAEAAATASALLQPQGYTCDVCDHSFDKLLAYMQHYERAHKLFKCPFCVKSFKRRHVLESHLVVHSNRRDFACAFCKGQFKRETDLRQHIRRMHAPRTQDEEGNIFNCEHCAYRTKHKRLMRTHALAHLGVSLFVCTLCGKSCADRTDLRAHRNSHVGIKPYQCDVCGNHFARKHHMLAHRKLQHEELYSYQCDVCGRAFSYKTSLVSHLKLHTGENRVPCDVCNRMLSGKVALANHKKIHASEKEFVCGICGKMYVNKYSLQEHVLVHTASKPFQCLQCDKSFSMRKKLLNHERIHDQIRSVFRCTRCGKSYLSKFRLKEHVQKVHTSPPPLTPSLSSQTAAFGSCGAASTFECATYTLA